MLYCFFYPVIKSHIPLLLQLHGAISLSLSIFLNIYLCICSCYLIQIDERSINAKLVSSSSSGFTEWWNINVLFLRSEAMWRSLFMLPWSRHLPSKTQTSCYQISHSVVFWHETLCSFQHTHTHTHIYIQAHAHSLSHTHSHTNTHKHTHTNTLRHKP